ncbi:putative cytochrome c oxidase subunit 1-alpha [Pseudoclavibacter endophyticus]|uniref:Cytochrome c oxidase subunit 1 n=1 Tax=Pseudoclavibacter endophyticus TaxID=1778590 RepID=A0A6H9WM59_9MICO|nr:cytochrome c oxidase subunit I [Pseudoclavibacter endophyticus]KAB1650233.1 cytochrome c oxidase subunit I [Pseudoclavibacter endophyticus]GGA55980.1 putative cytochrome c oxidase subunit 1-alpha [Pseudoclavibacter endophyticus]
MTSTLNRPAKTIPVSEANPVPSRTVARKGNTLVNWLSSTDHKVIGYMYLISSVIWFCIGGVMALLIRAQLFEPGMELIASRDQYNQLFTMHGTIMLLMFATPLFSGFANVLVPLQIGTADVAFPRLNAFAFWLFTFGAIVAVAGFLTPSGAAAFGWTAYTPLSLTTFSPGVGGNLWTAGLAATGFSTIFGAVNFITTIVTMRAPGMTMWRMPIFTWNALITSILVLFAFPVLAVAWFGLLMDRVFLTHIYDVDAGGTILYQHLFWFFGHPEVYVIALPFFGIVSEIFPVFSRKPIFGYKTLVGATIAIAALSASVWAHHMYVTGSVLLPFFALMTMLIAVPTGVKIFNWIGTMWRGSITFETPMLWSLGFLVTFIFGGLTGVILASPVLDFHLSDTYFVVAHFHYVVFGTVVFAMFAGFYFWWPKWTGKMLNERLGKIHFWLLFVGFHMTFLIQHWLGVMGMPRRYSTYQPEDDLTWMNQLSSLGAIVLAISMIPFFLNLLVTAVKAPKVEVDDPWGYGASLEWATSCPPPRHNFTSIPRIRSERPAFDLHHPELQTVMVGRGPLKDAPQVPVTDEHSGEVK